VAAPSGQVRTVLIDMAKGASGVERRLNVPSEVRLPH